MVHRFFLRNTESDRDYSPKCIKAGCLKVKRCRNIQGMHVISTGQVMYGTLSAWSRMIAIPLFHLGPTNLVNPTDHNHPACEFLVSLSQRYSSFPDLRSSLAPASYLCRRGNNHHNQTVASNLSLARRWGIRAKKIDAKTRGYQSRMEKNIHNFFVVKSSSPK